MKVVTVLELGDELAAAVRLGLGRKQLSATVADICSRLLKELATRCKATADAFPRRGTLLTAALDSLLETGDGLMTAHEIAASAIAVVKQCDTARPSLVKALKELRDLSGLPIPAEWLPAGARPGFAAAATSGVDPEFSADSMLNTCYSLATEHLEAVVRTVTFWRLWALHALTLQRISAAPVDAAAISPEEVHGQRTAFAQRSRELRDAARAAARAIAGGRAGPAFMTRLWLAVDAFETWLLSRGTRLAAAACGVATACFQSGDANAEASARDAALLYDEIRTGLALDAGVRTFIAAYAFHDDGCIAELRQACSLPAGSQALDLPRSSLDSVGLATEGDLLEVAGLVRQVDVRAGGPAPRSVLRLGAPPGTQLQVLVPFSAVDSFGVKPGVWIQARGKAFPNGKDDLTGAVLQVGRIQREQAASASFFDYLVYAGRSLFEYRPGGLDLVAGRLAGDPDTLAEVGLRLLLQGGL